MCEQCDCEVAGGSLVGHERKRIQPCYLVLKRSDLDGAGCNIETGALPIASGGIVDVGPYVALIALLVGTPYMAYKKQWVLAGYVLLNAVAIVSGTFLGAMDLANMLTWASLVVLAFGIFQLLQKLKASRSVS
jgi:hypothetical protein